MISIIILLFEIHLVISNSLSPPKNSSKIIPTGRQKAEQKCSVFYAVKLMNFKILTDFYLIKEKIFLTAITTTTERIPATKPKINSVIIEGISGKK